MDQIQERQRNHAAFRQLKDSIQESYPPGRFVAISGGQIVADAGCLAELRTAIKSMGKDPAQVLIVQAGVEYPETAVIFVAGLMS